MKTRLQRLWFLPILLGMLFATSLWLTPAIAFAAPTQTHMPKMADAIGIQNDCTASQTDDVVIATDGGQDVDCVHGEGQINVGLYNVVALQTGQYILNFTWKDYDGAVHNSIKEPETFLAAGNASANAFAGYGSMAEITSLTLSAYVHFHPDDCSDGGMGVRIATHANNSTAYYTLCFSSPGTHAVGLYGVYALYTGDYTLIFTWKDYAGGTHVSSKPPTTFLASGNASLNGFAGASSMAMITSIDLSL